MLDNSSVAAEVVAVNEVVAEYGTYWYYHCDDVEATYDEMIAKIKKVGGVKIMEEYNKQFREWWEASHN